MKGTQLRITPVFVLSWLSVTSISCDRPFNHNTHRYLSRFASYAERKADPNWEMRLVAGYGFSPNAYKYGAFHYFEHSIYVFERTYSPVNSTKIILFAPNGDAFLVNDDEIKLVGNDLLFQSKIFTGAGWGEVGSRLE